MKCAFIKLSPTQNMTVLVTSPVPRERQSAVAEKLIGYANVHAEQAGFWEKPNLPGARARLQMMGGEFCGNAAMSLAACIARKDALAAGDTCSVALEVSGAPGICGCEVLRTGETAFVCRVNMPLPESVENRNGMTLVRMPGIAHFIVPHLCENREDAGRDIRLLAEQVSEDAVGLVFFREQSAEIEPLVYVRGTDSCVWERGCGSGSAAVGAMLARRNRADVKIRLKQPGGVIETEAVWTNGALTGLTIRGQTRVVAEGTAYIEDEPF